MENQIREILNKNFTGSNIDKTVNELCYLLRIVRTDEPICPCCDNKDSNFLIKIADYEYENMTGKEINCLKCDTTFDFNDYKI